MSSLILSKCIFLHIPKTGGTSVCHFLRQAGVSCVEAPRVPSHFQSIARHGHADKLDLERRWYLPPMFAFVRKPEDWYRSVWAYRQRAGWSESRFDRRFGSSSFTKFVRNLLSGAPGHVTRLYEQFVGTYDNPIGIIGRTESLETDLRLALKIYDEPHDPSTEFPKRNVSENLPTWDPGLLVAVREAEALAMKRFGYE